MKSRIRGVRSLALAAFVVVPVALAFAASGAAAPNPEAVDHGGEVSASFVPLSLSSAPTTVVVQLRGRSVAQAQADAGRKLTGAEKNQIKSQLKASQDGLTPQIQAAGGTVLAQFQGALNGIKVQIAGSKLGQLAALPGVAALLPVHADVPDNAVSVPYIGAPTVWSAPTNYRGEGIKIAVIDTGIDYTHANFAGPGTVAAYMAANATDTAPANPMYFGPLAPRVKGGFDLVGDAYNANVPALSTPAPDPNPLDCFGHGSHVAGTAAGNGVTAGGATYGGPYDSTIYTPGFFRIGPGVAPKADIYAYRVFGCAGSTNVTVDAINMAFDDGVDVINMSLGSPFGSADDASAVASTDVAKAGVIVVASAGNNGVNQYITGSPGTGTGTISVAANDANPGFPAATMAISTDGSITAQNSNGAPFTNGTVLGVAVLRTTYPSGPVSLGCSAADYATYPGGVAGKLVVTERGTCSRVARAIWGEQAGAAAVAMINDAASGSGYPPFEGPITGSLETGPFNVTIPFFGIRGVLGPAATADPDNLITADSPQGAGGTVTLTNTALVNPSFTSFASFSSGGPRTGDSWLKPDVTAPGVSTYSTFNGTGNLGTFMSGTSMAAPHVAGVAALVRQAHPGWKQVQEWKAAIVNTGNPAAISGLLPYKTSRGGTGLVQPISAVATNVIALGDTATSTLNFGFDELKADYSQSRQIKLRNKGGSSASFNIAQTNAAGSPHSVVLGAGSVTIPAGGEATVNVTLNVPVATVGDSNAAALSFREVAGLVTFTPTGGSNNGVALRVPYYLVPRALSGVNATMQQSVTTGSPSTNANLSNPSGPITGNADFYAWGLDDPNEAGNDSADVRAIGVQSFADPIAADPNRRLLVFAVNTWDRWSNAAANEYDIYVDVDQNGIDDYVLVAADQGRLTTGTANGRLVTAVFPINPSAAGALAFFAVAPTDSSTALLPVRSSNFCAAGHPCMSTSPDKRFTYHAFGFGDTTDTVAGSAKFNAGPTSAISQGMFASVPVGASGAVSVTINPAEWALTPALGSMIVSLDNKAGNEEAALLPLELK